MRLISFRSYQNGSTGRWSLCEILSSLARAQIPAVSLTRTCQSQVAMISLFGHPRPQNPWNIPPPLNVRIHLGQVFPLRSPTHNSRVDRSAYMRGSSRITAPLLIGLAEQVLSSTLWFCTTTRNDQNKIAPHSVSADSFVPYNRHHCSAVRIALVQTSSCSFGRNKRLKGFSQKTICAEGATPSCGPSGFRFQNIKVTCLIGGLETSLSSTKYRLVVSVSTPAVLATLAHSLMLAVVGVNDGGGGYRRRAEGDHQTMDRDAPMSK